MTKPISILTAVLFAGALGASAASYTETFDTSLGAWTTTGYLTDGGMNLGWQNSANAGGTAGEVGGLITRYSGGGPVMPRILDTQHFLGTPLDLTSPITVSGSMYLNDVAASQDVYFGYFNSADPDVQRLVLDIRSPGTTGSGIWRFRTYVSGTSGNATVPNNTWNNAPLTFNLTWTPTGGGAGTLSGSVYNGANTLPLGSVTVGANSYAFDAFGMWVNSSSSSDPTKTQNEFFDNVTYTVTVIPEPTAGLLLVMGMAALVFRKRS